MIALFAADLDPALQARIQTALEMRAPVQLIRTPEELAPDATLVVAAYPQAALMARAAALNVPLWTWLFGEPWEDPLWAHRRGRPWLRVRLVELRPDEPGSMRVRYEGAFKMHPFGPTHTLARIWPTIADWPKRALAAASPKDEALPRLHVSAQSSTKNSLVDYVFALRNLCLRLQQETLAEDWRIGLLPRPPAALLDWPTLEDAFWLPPRPGGGFFADPFGIETPAGRFVFVEDCPPGTDTAGLAVLRLDGANRLVEITPIETDLTGHLSSPFVFEHRGRFWMLPEHSASGQLLLLECLRFPDRWQTAAVLLADFAAVDPTLYDAGDRLWLFATNRREEDVTQLFLFSAPALTGPWRPHPANPVVCDLRAARPAGPLFAAGGTLFRPAQDCSRHYGSALTLCRIERLDERAFEQRIVLHLPPPTALPDGAHTLSPLGRGFSVIDAKRHCRDAATALRRLARHIRAQGQP